MTAVIDLTDKDNPPPDDPEAAPNGWVWDKNGRRGGGWQPRQRRRYGRAGGASENRPRNDLTVDEEISDDEFSQAEDPPPSWADGTPDKPPPAPAKVTAAVRKELSAAVGMVGMVILPPLVAADPYCGGALKDSFGDIANAVVPLLCQSPRVVAFFTDTASDWMLWWKLAVAMAPVAAAVGRHHVLKTVEVVDVVDDAGNVTGQAVVERDLSEYPAA
jgi:hypothetical protein